MSVSKVQTLTHLQNRARVDQNKELIVSRTSKVLAARNQAVVAVGAWVESGQDLLEHPSDLALLTDELQTEKRQKKEESLRRFQDEVRHRVAQRANIQRQQQPHINSEVTPHIRIPHHQVWEHQVSARKGKTAAETTLQQRSSPEPGEVTRQVRLRLAACRTIQPEETMSDLPGGRWNSSSTRRRDSSHMHRPEEDVLEEEEEEKDVPLFISQHECPLVQQKVTKLLACSSVSIVCHLQSVTFHYFTLLISLMLDISTYDEKRSFQYWFRFLFILYLTYIYLFICNLYLLVI
uniref:Coiled-coil domain containing 15 n=1 Tax=Nothobranchius furzeri TaxID=105023 RepID=A0A1A7ZSY5_NOTFU